MTHGKSLPHKLRAYYDKVSLTIVFSIILIQMPSYMGQAFLISCVHTMIRSVFSIIFVQMSSSMTQLTHGSSLPHKLRACYDKVSLTHNCLHHHLRTNAVIDDTWVKPSYYKITLVTISIICTTAYLCHHRLSYGSINMGDFHWHFEGGDPRFREPRQSIAAKTDWNPTWECCRCLFHHE